MFRKISLFGFVVISRKFREFRICPRAKRGDTVPGSLLRCPAHAGASSNYPVFKGPSTLYLEKMMPDGIAFVLTSSNERGGVPCAKKRFPVPNMTG